MFSSLKGHHKPMHAHAEIRPLDNQCQMLGLDRWHSSISNTLFECPVVYTYPLLVFLNKGLLRQEGSPSINLVMVSNPKSPDSSNSKTDRYTKV